MDAFCKSLFVLDKDAEQLAGEQLLSPPAFLDRRLLVLFDALWLKQSEDWSNRGVANMCSKKPFSGWGRQSIANFLAKQVPQKRPEKHRTFTDQRRY